MKQIVNGVEREMTPAEVAEFEASRSAAESASPAVPVLYAAASLKIVDFDITGIDVQSRFAGAFWVDVGKYGVIFAEAQPDTAYMAMASAGPCSAYVLEEEKAEDMFTITVTNAAGEPTDAAAVNISIVRAS
jgi:hypothetical protein